MAELVQQLWVCPCTCPSLHMRSYVSDVCLCVCGSGCVPCFSQCNVSQVVLVMSRKSNLRAGRRRHTLTGTSTGTFLTSTAQHEGWGGEDGGSDRCPHKYVHSSSPISEGKSSSFFLFFQITNTHTRSTFLKLHLKQCPSGTLVMLHCTLINLTVQKQGFPSMQHVGLFFPLTCTSKTGHNCRLYFL